MILFGFCFGVDMESKSMMDVALIPSIDPIDIGLGSSEKSNVGPTLKPRKKTMTSIYLRFFETALDGKSRRCKFCGQSYSLSTATGNSYTNASILWVHLFLVQFELPCSFCNQREIFFVRCTTISNYGSTMFFL